MQLHAYPGEKTKDVSIRDEVKSAFHDFFVPFVLLGKAIHESVHGRKTTVEQPVHKVAVGPK